MIKNILAIIFTCILSAFFLANITNANDGPKNIYKVFLDRPLMCANDGHGSVVSPKVSREKRTMWPCSSEEVSEELAFRKRNLSKLCDSTHRKYDEFRCGMMSVWYHALKKGHQETFGNNSKAQAGEGTVNLCLMPSSSGGNPMWTIALGANRNQALQNRRLIMPEGCKKQITCDGGWYAVAMNKGRGTGIGFSCGHNSRQAAISDARNRCISNGRGNSDCNSCISGKTTGENKVAQAGTVWMGNRFSKYCD